MADLCEVAAAELEKGGYEPEAIKQYEKAREHDPSRLHLSRRLAVLHARQGKPALAAAEYDTAVRAYPRDAELLNDLGYFHYQGERFEEAERWLRRALEVDPAQKRAAVNLALVLGRQGRFDDCLKTFERVLSPAEAHHNLGVLLAQQGRIEEARLAFGQALKLQPGLGQSAALLAHLDGSDPKKDRAVQQASHSTEK